MEAYLFTYYVVLSALPALFFIGVVSPTWCLVDCGRSEQRSSFNKAMWVVALLVFWSVAGFFYVFTTHKFWLRWLTIFCSIYFVAAACFAWNDRAFRAAVTDQISNNEVVQMLRTIKPQ